jgi:hypothetical protein
MAAQLVQYNRALIAVGLPGVHALQLTYHADARPAAKKTMGQLR